MTPKGKPMSPPRYPTEGFYIPKTPMTNPSCLVELFRHLEFPQGNTFAAYELILEVRRSGYGVVVGSIFGAFQ